MNLSSLTQHCWKRSRWSRSSHRGIYFLLAESSRNQKMVLFRYETASHVVDRNWLRDRCQNQPEPHYRSLESNFCLRLIVTDHGKASQQKGFPVVLDHVLSA